MDSRLRKVESVVLTTHAAISGGMMSMLWVISKIIRMAVIGAWVVAATTAPMVTSA